MIASKRNAARQAILEARRLARKVVKGFQNLGVNSKALPTISHLETPKRRVVFDDSGQPAFEIRTMKAHAMHLREVLQQVNKLRQVLLDDPQRQIRAQIIETLNKLGNPMEEQRRAAKMQDVQAMKDHAAELEAEDETELGKEEADADVDQNG